MTPPFGFGASAVTGQRVVINNVGRQAPQTKVGCAPCAAPLNLEAGFQATFQGREVCIKNPEG